MYICLQFKRNYTENTTLCNLTSFIVLIFTHSNKYFIYYSTTLFLCFTHLSFSHYTIPDHTVYCTCLCFREIVIFSVRFSPSHFSAVIPALIMTHRHPHHSAATERVIRVLIPSAVI